MRRATAGAGSAIPSSRCRGTGCWWRMRRHALTVGWAVAKRSAPRCRPPWNGWESVPEGFEVITGKIKGGDRHGLVVAGRRLDLLPAARTLGAGLATQLFGAATSTTVTCLAGQGQLLGLISAGGLIKIPGSLGGIWWPGLDQVTRAWAGNLPAPAVPPPPRT